MKSLEMKPLEMNLGYVIRASEDSKGELWVHFRDDETKVFA